MRQEGTLTWDLLQGNLDRQIDAYQRLDQLLANENQVLIDHHVASLITITSCKEQLNQELQTLRDHYFHIVKQIVLDERPDQITVESLIGWAPNAYRNALINGKDQLERLARNIQKKNTINQGLLEQSMRYVSYMVKKIIELSNEPQQVYCQRGYQQTLGESKTLMNVVA